MATKYSFPKDKIKIYLLEKIHPAAAATFEQAGYQVTCIPKAIQGDELVEVIQDAHILGVRSRTRISAKDLQESKRLLSIGCFTVGTDQVDLPAAAKVGAPVFNAPHSSTRSVAELSIANVISLARQMPERSAKMHQGVWEKSADGSHEIRGKTLGIIGYGHIGQQVGLLAEAVGLNVYFYDVLKKLPLGRAQAVEDMQSLLKMSDFVSLHVPGGQETRGLIGANELKLMKEGSYLINLSRGNVVDLEATRDALISGHLLGAGFDVYPSEPAGNSDGFENILCGVPNVILTPHIGGSTEEAQRNIGREVAESLIAYLDNGSTEGAVNFPRVHLPSFPDSHRILYVHQNVPGALNDINQIIAELDVNIEAQYLSTHGDVGYLIMDINKSVSDEVRERISVLPRGIKTRILF
jgi:D-3-phosphoglycerate dehydrogenase